MKKVDLIIVLSLAILFLASCVDAQRTSRIFRPCPASTTPASVEVDREGDINITPCSGREIGITAPTLKVYDPAYATPNFSPATTRFSVGSTSYQTIPADNNYFGADFFSRVTAQNTTSKTFFGSRSSLQFAGTPAGTVNAIGGSFDLSSASGWNPAAGLGNAWGISVNVDIGANAGAFEMVGGRFRSHIGSVNVGSVTTLAGIEAYANYGYAATVTDTVGVSASTSSVSDFGGSTTNVKLFHATKSTTNSDATNFYGLYVGNYSGGTGTITNNYGIYLDSTIDQGTNRWAIRSDSIAPSLISGKLSFDATYTAGGTTGNQTINKPAFSVNFAASATSLTVTNSFVTSSASVLICTVQTNDSTMKSVAAVAGSGSVVLHANAAATAETKVYCEVKN